MKFMGVLFQTARVFAALMGSALVMAAWSELVFFNEDLAHHLIVAFDAGLASGLSYVGEIGLFYAIPAAFLLGVLNLCGSAGASRILLIGALTGFVIEGAVVPAVYEAVPFSYLWTSIAWHGPITVALGVFWLPRLMARVSVWRMSVIAAALGLAWGIWTPWTWISGDVAPVSEAAFYRFSAVTTGIMGIGYALLLAGGWPDLRLPRWTSVVLILPALALFLLQGSLLPVAAAGLFAILLVLAVLLRRLGADHEPAYQAQARALVPLALMPVVAGLVYGAQLENGALMAAEDVLALGLLGGMIVWIWGVLYGLIRRAAP